MLRLITTIYNKEFIFKDALKVTFYPPDETFKKRTCPKVLIVVLSMWDKDKCDPKLGS